MITDKMKEPRKFIQVVMGTRQIDSFLAFLQFGIAVRSQIELQILLGFFSSIIQFKQMVVLR